MFLALAFDVHFLAIKNPGIYQIHRITILHIENNAHKYKLCVKVSQSETGVGSVGVEFSVTRRRCAPALSLSSKEEHLVLTFPVFIRIIIMPQRSVAVFHPSTSSLRIITGRHPLPNPPPTSHHPPRLCRPAMTIN